MEPIYTKGNAFWRGDERFLIRGICYVPLTGVSEGQDEADMLAEDYLPNLKRDIQVFRELGLNTIQVTRLNPSNDHRKALELLNEAGIYVLVELFEDVKAPKTLPQRGNRFEIHFNTAPYYPVQMLKTALKIVDETRHHPNVLGFLVCGDAIRSPALSKIAEVSLAGIGDVKKFLRLRGGRAIPVGVRVDDLPAMRLSMLQYFTAGSRENRADFFAPECGSWVPEPEFQISSWERMAHSFAKYPVPIFLGAYAANVAGARISQEVDSLYSLDKTGVFSGGLYFDYCNECGIVAIREDGTVERKPDFQFLKEGFNGVKVRGSEESCASQVKDYESWTGEFPWIRKNRWHAGWHIPYFSGKWESLLEELEDEKEWVVVQRAGPPDLSSGD